MSIEESDAQLARRPSVSLCWQGRAHIFAQIFLDLFGRPAHEPRRCMAALRSSLLSPKADSRDALDEVVLLPSSLTALPPQENGSAGARAIAGGSRPF